MSGGMAQIVPPLKKDLLLRGTVLFLATAIAVFAALTVWNGAASRSLASRSQIREIPAGGYLLTDFDTSAPDGRVAYSLILSPELAKSSSLVVSRADGFTLYSPNSGDPAISLSGYWNIRTIPTDDPVLYNDESNTLALEWQVSNTSRPYSLYLVDSQELEEAMSLYQAVMFTIFGGICLLILYCISLYAFKRSESYLMFFSIYLVCTLISGLMRVDVVQFALVPVFPASSTASFFAGVQMLAMLAMGSRMLGTPVPELARPFITWQGVLLGGLAYYLVCGVTGSLLVAEVLRIALLFACAMPLLDGWARGARGAAALSLFYAFKVGIAFATVAVSLGLLTSSFAFVLIKPLCFLDIPFIPACMVIVNYYFARKFHEAETLARELASLNESLDRQVDQRTRELVEQQDRRHAMMLNIFHDLRSPIFTVRGCLELVKYDPAANRDMLEVARERTGFLSALTEDLFLLAKLETREVPIPFDRVDVSALAVQVSQSEKVNADAKGVLLSWDVQDGLAVWGNREHLGRMMQNVVSNAVHFTPEGRHVFVSARARGGSIVFRVDDEGGGIPQDQVGHVFEKYYRSERHGGSTGLGLAIAKEIADIHQGAISVDSAEGAGSAFTVTLPALP